ncbi:SPOR domain-containing protein [Gillisia sp. M10.2A]|uniref:SPOR domain-containing protein n=1 Tax=Gillisia lutea TaxID=2909668 RepID=A0ABS9EBC4_9FLAO|nr:SPOR domain-containing protein [Gillisia lutea]MCF4100191.1 SPOR domain-containing protein [Gillisia lutea]
MRILKIKDCILLGILSVAIHQTSSAQNGNINIQQDESIPELMNLKSEMTKDGKLGERYRIQLYYGDNNTASNVIKDFRSKYTEWPSAIIYETPNYKVWIGNFRNRLEADRALLKLKGDFPAAFIPKPQRG